MKFFPAEEVQDIAEELIPKHHKHLVGTRIDYLFSEKVPNKGGKDIWGSMRKVSGLTAYEGAKKVDQERGVTDPFFVLTISQPVWARLNDKEKTALVDHELCHATVKETDDGKVKLSTLCHDVEEFKSIVERYGLWRPDIGKFVEAAKKDRKKDVVETDGEDQDGEEVD